MQLCDYMYILFNFKIENINNNYLIRTVSPSYNRGFYIMASNSDPKRIRMLNAHYRKAIKESHPHVKFAMDEVDVNVWYIKFHSLDTPYKGGEYIVRFTAPKDFPFDPPGFEFLTPNGVFSIDGRMRPCVSIGEYHKGDYPSVLGMHHFPEQILGTLICWDALGGGISVINTTEAQKQKLADESVEFNETELREYNELIETAYTEYSSKFSD